MCHCICLDELLTTLNISDMYTASHNTLICIHNIHIYKNVCSYVYIYNIRICNIYYIYMYIYIIYIYSTYSIIKIHNLQNIHISTKICMYTLMHIHTYISYNFSILCIINIVYMQWNFGL